MTAVQEKLALQGGPKAVTLGPQDTFVWPIITQEDEQAVLDVLHTRQMSGTEITKQFEEEFAAWTGSTYALCAVNGTESIRAAIWACGVGAGDEVICPSMTYWASCASALTLGATVHFADIDPNTLCIDPNDIEHRIGPKTKAIIVVHYAGHPCDMDPIMAIARKHGIKVIEDFSHAQGGLYKGRMIGTIGDVGATSLMTGKSFAIGEGGILITNDNQIWQRATHFGHYERTGIATRWNPAQQNITDPELVPYIGISLFGAKHRINQMASAMGRVQLKYYPERIIEIQRAMNRFWDMMEGCPGVHAHRPAKDSGSTMGGWYVARGLYRSEELGGLSAKKYMEAVHAEIGDLCPCYAGANAPLHLHEYFHSFDLFRMGKPTVLSFGQRDVRQGKGSLPHSENIFETCISVPWFRKDNPALIEQFVAAYRKVATNATALRE